MEFGYWYNVGVVAAGVFFVYQQWLIRKREPARCFQAFLNNQYVGMAIFIGVLLQYAFNPA
jgi:4-hydroxybenzoate polyprenyltransferase